MGTKSVKNVFFSNRLIDAPTNPYKMRYFPFIKRNAITEKCVIQKSLEISTSHFSTDITLSPL